MNRLSGTTRQALLRIIDANLNRTGEGLRVLEEVARLLLNDASLTQELKTLRHDILRGDWQFHSLLLESRDADGDVGAHAEATGESGQRDLPVTVMANARRAQESLRLLEETAKLPDMPLPLPSDRYKQARFALYSIEQKLLSRLNRLDRAKLVSGTYAIVQDIAGAKQVIDAGARVLELQGYSSKSQLLDTAVELRILCDASGILLIVGEDLDVALASAADGLRIGGGSLPVSAMRRLLPPGRLLGVSVLCVAEAHSAESDGADYIVADIAITDAVRRSVSVPVVAGGQISAEEAAGILAKGGSVVRYARREVAANG